MSPFLPPKVSVPLSTPAEPSKGPCKRPIPRREPNTSSNRRSSSISSWVKQILPANRPERRGTIRRQGYWAQHEQRHPEKYSSHHQQPGKPQSSRGATVGSDSIVGWNMAKDIPDNESIDSHLLGQDCRQDADKKWSWVSGEDAKYHTAENRNHGAMPTALNGDQSRVNFADEPSSSESPTVSTAELELIRAKQETRRLRKNLKESGDYLGVQGFNPQTGKLDVITPSGSDGSSLSQETRQKLHILQNTLQTARHAYKSVKENSKREADRIVRKREKERFRRLERKKEHVQNMSKTVTWKRHARQWSSAQEPNLSPIAQSATGTAPETYDDNGSVHGASGPSLIDFGSEEEQGQAIDSTNRGKGHSNSPDSTITVVRTPHRQSLAEFAESAPSAWELFVNGISFDSSDDPKPAEPGKPGSFINISGAVDNGPCLAEQLSGKKFRKSSQDHLPTPEQRAEESDGAFQNKATNSFLGIDRLGVQDPRGCLAPLSKSESNRDKAVVAAHTTSLMNQESEIPRVDSTMCRKGNPLKRPKLPAMDPNQAFKSLALSHSQQTEGHVQTPTSRKRLTHNWGHWMSGRRGSRDIRVNNAKTRQEQMVTPNEGIANLPCLRTRQTPSNKPAATSDSLTERAVPENTSFLGTASGVKSRLGANLHVRLKDAGQIQGRAAAERGLAGRYQLKPEYASTHTITTTGCDRSHLAAEPRTGIERDEGERQDLPPSHTLAYRPHQKNMCARNSASSVMKTLQNPSPSPGWAGRDIEADTISKRRPLPTNQGEKRPAAEVEGIVAKALAKQEARGPTVRGESFEGKFPGQKKDRRAIDKTAEAKPAAIDEVGQNTRGNHGGVGKGAAQDVRKDVGEIAAEKATESDQARVCDSSQEHRGVVGVGYPSTFTESSAVVGCQILQTTPGGALGSRTRRLLEIAWCHIVAFLLVYWEKVGPVFDARSDYWARNSRKEATLEDCYVLVLAVPAGVLAVASIVWAMRLATICGENAELLKEWLSDVLWCF